MAKVVWAGSGPFSQQIESKSCKLDVLDEGSGKTLSILLLRKLSGNYPRSDQEHILKDPLLLLYSGLEKVVNYCLKSIIGNKNSYTKI